jgi:hypothetical protein
LILGFLKTSSITIAAIAPLSPAIAIGLISTDLISNPPRLHKIAAITSRSQAFFLSAINNSNSSVKNYQGYDTLDNNNKGVCKRNLYNSVIGAKTALMNFGTAGDLNPTLADTPLKRTCLPVPLPQRLMSPLFSN